MQKAHILRILGTSDVVFLETYLRNLSGRCSHRDRAEPDNRIKVEQKKNTRSAASAYQSVSVAMLGWRGGPPEGWSRGCLGGVFFVCVVVVALFGCSSTSGFLFSCMRLCTPILRLRPHALFCTTLCSTACRSGPTMLRDVWC